MPRLIRLVAVLSAVGIATPALAHCHKGIGIQIGGIFIGGYKHRRHCHDVVYVPAAPVVQGQVVVQPAPVQYAYPQPPVYAPPPPPPVVVAPQYQQPVVYQQPVYTPPPIVYAQPQAVVVQKPQPARDDRPGFLALKYMPGMSTSVSIPDGDLDFGTPSFAHSPGIELRLTRWLSLRSDLEFRKDSRTWDMLGVKLSLLPRSFIKPYASVSFSGNENLSNPGKFSFGFAGAAGVDVMIGKYFFVEAEARYRMSPGNCCSEVPTLTGVIGGGVAFF
ncbi:MAG: hypothetical protein JNM17_38275 [Archangium sp.]|nr:hypothetical protein [Archangium sp.]